MKWEYKRATGRLGDESVVTQDFGLEKLSEIGNDGWEMVSVVFGRDYLYYFFKRPKANDQ